VIAQKLLAKLGFGILRCRLEVEETARMMLLAIIAAIVSFAGCSTISYSPPEARSFKENIVTLPVARDPLWKDFVSQLSG
jgi:hypothetical protein